MSSPTTSPPTSEDENGSLSSRARTSNAAKATETALKRGRRPSLWSRFCRAVSGSGATRTEQTMLPVLIQVFAGFTKLDGRVDEADIDSILGFLRYDYPETVYTELRELYSGALSELHD